MSGPLHIVSRMLTTPARWSMFWLYSREWRLAGKSSLLLLTLLSAIVLYGQASRIDKVRLQQEYLDAVSAALKADDVELAKLWLGRLVQLQPDDQRTLFYWALIERSSGNVQRSTQILEKLAPDSQPGYAPAHALRAEQMMTQGESWDAPRMSLIRYHLEQAERANRVSDRVFGMFGVINMKCGDAAMAVDYFTKASKIDEQWLPMLAQAQLSSGDTASAERSFSKLRERFKQAVAKNPADVDATLNWSRCEMALGNLSSAEEIVRAGLTVSNDAKYGRRLVEIYIARYDSIVDEKPAMDSAASIQALSVLDAAVRIAPADPDVINRLCHLSNVSESIRPRLKNQLDEMLQDQSATPLVHFVLGVIGLDEQEFELARDHFEICRLQGLATSSVLNNMAWAQLHQKSADLSQALELVQAAHALDPDNYEIIDTRGHIYARQAQLIPAISDLERAIPHIRHVERSRRTLQTCYAQLQQQRGE